MKFKPIKEIKKASVLLSNDDGINSIGIKILEEELQKTGADITVVAPWENAAVPGMRLPQN